MTDRRQKAIADQEPSRQTCLDPLDQNLILRQSLHYFQVRKFVISFLVFEILQTFQNIKIVKEATLDIIFIQKTSKFGGFGAKKTWEQGAGFLLIQKFPIKFGH